MVERGAQRPTIALLLCMSVLLHAPGARAVCRVVETIGERGGVQFDPTTMVLYVLAPNQLVGYQCATPDAGVPADAGTDAGPTLPADAMVPIIDVDVDAGRDDDAGALGFEVAFQRVPPPLPDPMVTTTTGMPLQPACPGGVTRIPVRGSVVHMVVQPSVLSTAGHAGLVMPVPARPDIHAPSNADLFLDLGSRLQPRVVTIRQEIEDESLGYQCQDNDFGCGGDDDSGDDYDFGPTGDGRGEFYDPDTADGGLETVMIGEGIVSFAEVLSTADYDVSVVNATTIEALNTWLDLNGFAHDAEDDAAFAAYVAEGAWFVALDVHPAGTRELSPLVVSFPGEEIPLMHRLQFDTGGGQLVTEAFVMAPQRMDAADGSAETLYAAQVGFGGAVAGFGLVSGWLTHLRFERTTDEWMNDSTLVTSLAGELRPVLERRETVRIPSSKCPDKGGFCGGGGGDDDGCLCSAPGTHGGGARGTIAPVALACLWLALRSRRRSY